MSTAWTRYATSWRAVGGRVLNDTPTPPGGGGSWIEAEAGAVLPLASYSLATLPGTKRYVSPSGNDSNAGTAEGSPKLTLQSAINASANGDSIVLRGGTHDLEANIATVNKSVTIVAYPGELPVFDGSQAAPGSATTDGATKKFAYTPMQAKASGEGFGLTQEAQFPPATFDGSGNPTGFAADRGWAIVTGSAAYSYPATQNSSSLTAGASAKVITGIFPDQCWVDGVALKQVLAKSLVKPGYFYVGRTTSDDTNPVSRFMYLDPADAADMSKVRVSKSGTKTVSSVTNGYFLFITANNVTLRGFKVFGHSPSFVFFTVQTQTGISGLRIEDVEFDSCASITLKLYGDQNGSSFNGAKIVSDTTLERVTVRRAGLMGMSAQYTDDTTISHCLFEDINLAGEIDASPKSGAIKATKCHRMRIEYSIFRNILSHGVWLDQSNYDCTFAGNYLTGIQDSYLFWEISHKILVANNLFVKSGNSGIVVRVSGGSGAKFVNNTIVGGANPFYIIAELRGQQTANGRWLSEHTERYGAGGSYDADSPSGSASDLDKARPGAYAVLPLVNMTPGMNFKGGATMVLNNVIGHWGSSNVAAYFRGKTSNTNVNVPANEVVPPASPAGSFDGNIYQSQNSLLAQVDVKSGAAGAIPVANTLAAWRGVNGLGQAHYNGLVAEAYGIGASSGYVLQTGAPTTLLEGKQGTAAPVPTDAAINLYVPAGSRNYGASIAPPGGW
jgi:hypothetical protein